MLQYCWAIKANNKGQQLKSHNRSYALQGWGDWEIPRWHRKGFSC
jgi:hypothetical protein